MSLATEPKMTTLPNGVVVVTEAMPHIASVSLAISVGAGARAETDAEHGIAHLLEHMAFKGTARRSAHEIADEIEAVGGDINAFTSMESTTYTARLLSEDMGLGVDVLADIVTASVHDAEELERERGVIRQEIAAVLDTPDDLVFEHMSAAAFPGQTLGRSILGTDESVASFSRADVRAFLDRHYVGSHTIVAAAGALEHDRLVDLVAQHLGQMRAEGTADDPPARFVGGDMRDERDTEQVNIAIAFPGRPMRDDDMHAARMFAQVLGGGMASRLFQEIRERRGLCYTISSFHWGYDDVGLMGIHAGTAPEDVDDLVATVLDEIERASRDIEEREVVRAKVQSRANLLMSLESAGARADRLSRQVLLYGRPRPLEEVARAIDRITVDDIRAFGRGLVEGGRIAFAAVGPVADVRSPAFGRA